ncbi:MAG: methyltransferase [Bacilli bacterium]|nr:methyltransferase [Bacilli bacterium]MDD4298328.1 methyltransferase [Bacilli bacterium]MDD4643993.1 methyltransferase [Bacilli bacterium]
MNHYFTNNKNLKSDINKISVIVLGKSYSLFTDNGVFSKKALDFGTRLLIESLPLPEMSGKVLDVGCGYGPIGLFVKSETDCEVDMVDINLRALHLAKIGARHNHLSVNIYESDAYSNVKPSYDYIITNPPIRAGKEKVYEILMGASDFLTSKGQLWFVMRKNQGVKSTLVDMGKCYNVSIKKKDKGFYVVCATKKEKIVDND